MATYITVLLTVVFPVLPVLNHLLVADMRDLLTPFFVATYKQNNKFHFVTLHFISYVRTHDGTINAQRRLLHKYMCTLINFIRT